MLIILPIGSWIIIFIIFYKKGQNWRNSLISTSLVWGILITGITELFSYLKIISFAWLLGAWVLIDIILVSICLRFRYQMPLQLAATNIFTTIKKIYYSKKTIYLFLSSVGLIVVILGMIARIAPPNNWDSMDYHMSRIMYWIQHHSIAYYPTSYTPQLYQNPWSEYAILHFQILSGGDYYANLVQWFSMIACMIAVSLIAKQLGADLRGQVFAAIFSATIPMGILQATSTQNDYVLAFWVVCLAYYVLLSLEQKTIDSYANSLQVGSSLGLAILTKGTAYTYVFPFLILFVLSQIKKLRWQVWKPLVSVATISLSLNISHYLRNYNLFGSPLGEPSIYKNEVLGLTTLISNILRNLALHIGTPIGLWNGIANKLIQIIHTFLGVDVNDPRTTFAQRFFVPGGWSTLGFPGNENSAGNLVHLLLIILCITIFLFNKLIRKQSYIFVYLATVVFTFVVFCFLIKWQPWNSRLHLPFFVLMSPFVGVLLSKIKKEKVAIFIVLILLLTSLPWVFFNRYRPLVDSNNIFNTSRTEQYFSNRPYLNNVYFGAIEFLNSKQCSDIGLTLGSDPWEYPLWIIWQQNTQKTVKIQHINVTNVSAVIQQEHPYKQFEPCGIIYMETKKSKQQKRQEINFKDKIYIREWGSPNLGVFIKK
ncbi:glycosyltransferase family 39 protein [Nostoc sp. UHCC 0702]|nr:glycosyltransferase family 39 protein [Nostoc sp. UHCC 0702]